MVTNPRATLRAGTFKPLNTPEPVNVEEDSTGSPVAVKIKSAGGRLADRLVNRLAVSAIENTWRIDDEWWRSDPVSRIYYAVLLTSSFAERICRKARSAPKAELHPLEGKRRSLGEADPGQRLVLFKDLKSNGWYQQSC